MGGMLTIGAGEDHHPARRAGRVLTAAVTLMLLAAAISEAAIALRIVGLDRSTGGWDARDLLVVAACCVLVFGGPVFTAAAFTRLADGLRSSLPLVALATGALVVARYYSYDSYYWPDLIRMSEGILPGWWIALLVALALGAAVLSWRDLRTSLYLTGIVMFLAGPTVFVAGLGH